MAECLNCHKELVIEDRHHGTIFTCPHCNAVFFCGWDGSLEMAQHVPEPEHEPEQEQQQGLEQEQELEQESIPEPIVGHEPASSFEPVAEITHEAEPLANHEAEVMPDSNSDFQQATFSSDHSNAFHQSSESTSAVAGPETFSEVTDFANNNDVSLTDVSYRLVIEGIDTAKIHETFVEAITDSRFGWDKNDVLAKIQNGKLELRNLTPAKTSVLVNRIKHLEVVIRWYYES